MKPDRYLIDIIGNAVQLVAQISQNLIIDIDELTLKDHLPDELTTGAASAVFDLAVYDFQFLICYTDMYQIFPAFGIVHFVHFPPLIFLRGFRGRQPSDKRVQISSCITDLPSLLRFLTPCRACRFLYSFLLVSFLAVQGIAAVRHRALKSSRFF